MGDPLLRQVAQPVMDCQAPHLVELVADLQDTMAAHSGAGLAAPQIGVLLRVVIFGGEVRPLPRTLVGQFQPFNDVPFDGSSDLQPGQRVLIQAGAFEGLEAVFAKSKGTDRAHLLITVLGQLRSVEVPMDSVDAC